MAVKKQEIVTFKVDEALSEALRSVPNRSAFIRTAILRALENTCPLCCGTGVMTPDQKRHWDALSATHAVEECDDCHARHLVCTRPPKSRAKRRKTRRTK